MKALLGIRLDAELSKHDGCPRLDEAIPDEKLAANPLKNASEVQRGIDIVLFNQLELALETVL